MKDHLAAALRVALSETFQQLLRRVRKGDLEALAVASDWLQEQGATRSAAEGFVRGFFWPNFAPHRYYDTVGFGPAWTTRRIGNALGPVLAGSRYEFFRDLAYKHDHETNLRASRRLPVGVKFWWKQIRVDTRGMTPEFAAVSTVSVGVNNRPPWRQPLRVLLDASVGGILVDQLSGPLNDNDDLIGTLTAEREVDVPAPLEVTLYLEGHEVR